MQSSSPEHQLTPAPSWPRWSTRRWIFALLALVALDVLATLPGLVGDFVYDDRLMVGNACYDEGSDVLATFARTSDDFQFGPGRSGAVDHGGRTYRPITMITLVLSQVVFGSPLAHHVVSLGLHVATIAFLVAAIRRRAAPRRSSDAVAFVVAGLVLLHPSSVEAYVWINGRSDLVAGLWLAWLLFVRVTNPNAHVATSLLVCLGALSKETFVFAAAFAVLATLPEARRDRLHVGLAIGIAIAVAGAARIAVGASSGAHLGGGSSVLSDASVWRFLPKMLAMAASGILGMNPSPMRSLAYEAIVPLSWQDGLGAAVFVAASSVFVVRRDVRGALLVVGALVCVLPCVVIVRAVWLGFDRYLYMPILLVAFAQAPHVSHGIERLSRHVRPALPALGAVILVLAFAANTSALAGAYADVRTHEASMLSARPRDVTIPLSEWGCAIRTPADARLVSAYVREFAAVDPLPRSAVIMMMRCADTLGDLRLAEGIGRRALVRYPESLPIRIATFETRMRLGDVHDAVALVSPFRESDSTCGTMRVRVAEWMHHVGTDEERGMLARVLEDWRCPMEP